MRAQQQHSCRDLLCETTRHWSRCVTRVVPKTVLSPMNYLLGAFCKGRPKYCSLANNNSLIWPTKRTRLEAKAMFLDGCSLLKPTTVLTTLLKSVNACMHVCMDVCMSNKYQRYFGLAQVSARHWSRAVISETLVSRKYQGDTGLAQLSPRHWSRANISETLVSRKYQCKTDLAQISVRLWSRI